MPILFGVGESEEFKNFFKVNSERWIEIPLSPSAEVYSLMFLKLIDYILKNTKLSNGEGEVKVSSVRVHETKTGYAEAFQSDLEMIEFDIDKIVFSNQVIEEWKDKEKLLKILNSNKT